MKVDINPLNESQLWEPPGGTPTTQIGIIDYMSPILPWYSFDAHFKYKEYNNPSLTPISLSNNKKWQSSDDLIGPFLLLKLYFLKGSRQNIAETKYSQFHLRVFAVSAWERC